MHCVNWMQGCQVAAPNTIAARRDGLHNWEIEFQILCIWYFALTQRMATRPETLIPFPIVCWGSLQHLQLHLGGTPTHYLLLSSILLEHDFKHSCHLMTPWFAHLPLLQFHMPTFHILWNMQRIAEWIRFSFDMYILWFKWLNHCTFRTQITLMCTWQGWPEGHLAHNSQ